MDPSPFAGDDGGADPELAAALEAAAAGGSAAAALARLAQARVLVPVVARLDEAVTGEDGLAREKSSHMAVVSTTGRDGRRGLLAFTSVATMARWDRAARPVPVIGADAAAAALAEGCDALVIDLAGPVQLPVEGTALHRLAVVRTSRGHDPLTF